MSIKSMGTTAQTQYKAGAAMGIFAGIPIDAEEHYYLEPGIYFQMNGATITSNPKGSYTFTAINFPINLEYKSGTRCGKRTFYGIGPYISSTMAASFDFEAYNGIPAYSGSFKISPTPDFTLKKYDFGLGVNFGVMGRRNLAFRLHYQMGFMNMLAGGDDKNSLKQSAGGVTICYVLRGCNRGKGHRAGGVRGNTHWRGIKKSTWSTHQIFHRPNGPGL